MMVCNTCKAKNAEDPFLVPADKIGIEIMKSHLLSEHGIQVQPTDYMLTTVHLDEDNE